MSLHRRLVLFVLPVLVSQLVPSTSFGNTSPAAGIPILETIYVFPISGRPGAPARITSIGYGGICYIQPADTIELRIRAPYPTQLQLLIDGTAIQDVTPPGSNLPQPDDPGYYKYSTQQLPGYAPRSSPPPPGLNWFFWTLDVKLPKQFRYSTPTVSVPPFTLTVRDISYNSTLTGTQKQAPDLNLAMAEYPSQIDPNAPSIVFSSGENSKDDPGIFGRHRSTLGIVARDVTLAGWLVPTKNPREDWCGGNACPLGASEDWHFTLWLDPDFIKRNYTPADAAPLATALAPGQPETDICGIPFAPSCPVPITLTSGQFPNAGTFLFPGGGSDFDVELNAWHKSARGHKPDSYVDDPCTTGSETGCSAAYSDNAWAFNPVTGVVLAPYPPHNLAFDDYVIVTGTLWQDIAHVKSDPVPTRVCFESVLPGHGGWLEIHPADVVRYVWPPPASRKHPELLTVCENGPGQWSYSATSPPPDVPAPDDYSVLKFQEIVDPRFTNPNTGVGESIQVDSCDPVRLNLWLELFDQRNTSPAYYKSVVLVWWEQGSVPRPQKSTCLTVIEVSNCGGPFNLQIDDKTIATVFHQGSTGPQRVSSGAHTLGETAEPGVLGNCKVTFGSDCGVSRRISNTEIGVTLSQGENRVCTIGNSNGSTGGCGAREKCCEAGDTRCARCWPSDRPCP